MANTAFLNRALKGIDEVPFLAGGTEYHPKPSFGGSLQYSKYDLSKFVQTAFDGDLTLLEKMLDREDPVEGYHHDINEHYGEYNALHMAAANGQTEAVDMLLKSGADPHVKRSMPLGQDPDDGESATEIAEKWGYDDIVEMLKKAEKSYPKGIYMRYGPRNNAKLWPMDKPEGLDVEQEKRARAKLKGMVKPLPATKADFKFYGDLVFGLTHGYDEEGRVLKNRMASAAGGAASALTDGLTTCALMFPGQGSQYLNMMAGLDSYPRVKEMLATAKEVLGFDLLQLCQAGPEDKLESTEVCLPLMFVADLVAVETLRASRPEAAERPGAVCGLSVGEYAAIVAAGVLSFEDGLKIVKVYADAISEAIKSSPTAQASLSIAGMDRAKVQELCSEAAKNKNQTCQIAQELFPKGFVCAGGKAAIEELVELANRNNALQCKLLKNPTAFHTQLMEPARAKLEQALKEAVPKMNPPTCSIYLNSSGSAFRAGSKPENIIPALCDQLVKPVLWESCVKGMIAAGMTEFYECGPMKQLKAMMKRIDQTTWGNTMNVEV